MSAILPDPREAQKRREYFLECAAPIFRHMAKIHATYSRIMMVFDRDGKLVSDTKTLPDYAQKWIRQCEEAVEQCRQLAETVKL